MDIVATIMIAVGLAMDAFAVSIAHGLSKNTSNKDALKLATCFGFFQAFMPVVGWAAGLKMTNLISGIDHWIAFGLLGLVGGKMIYESARAGSTRNDKPTLNVRVLLMLSVATSIDALAVGLSFAFLSISISQTAVLVGLTTFLLSFLGVPLGSKIANHVENKIEMGGGLILIAIGTKILIEHSA